MNTTRLPSTESPFEALEKERKRRLLIATAEHLIVIVVPIIAVFGVLALAIPGWQTLAIFIYSGMMSLILYVARALARRNHTQLGGYLFLLYMNLMIFANSVLIEGLWPAAAPSFAPFIVMAGMVLGPTGAYVVAVYVSGLWILGLWLTTAQVVVPVATPTPLLLILTGSIIITAFVFTALMSQLATKDLRRALSDATYDLVQVNRQLEEANSLKSQFMARTSHELRTPLNSIIGFSDLAVRKVYGPLTDLQDEGLKRVLSNARRLLTLINDILDLSKIEAGEMQLVEREFKFKSLVDTVEATLSPRAREKNIKLSMFLSPEMPEAIVADEVRLSQIIVNLIDNAIKYTDAGEVEATFDRIGSTQWRVKVRDTGRGIHEKDLTRIFEEFYQGQGDVPGARRDGAGLGLSITNHLVKLMRGKISVESRLGKGSTFEVLLPLKAAQTEAAAAVVEASVKA